MKHIDINEILKFSESLKPEGMNSTYFKSYSSFIKYFSEKDVLTEDDLIIGANFTYGWMPTILKFKSDNFSDSVKILNKAKLSDRISKDEILELKSMINNSLVGVSKLLHFINPDVYAIWDSKVCDFLIGKSHKYLIEDVSRYFEYLDLCLQITSEPKFKEAHANASKAIGYEISSLRLVELFMFFGKERR